MEIIEKTARISSDDDANRNEELLREKFKCKNCKVKLKDVKLLKLHYWKVHISKDDVEKANKLLSDNHDWPSSSLTESPSSGKRQPLSEMSHVSSCNKKNKSFNSKTDNDIGYEASLSNEENSDQRVASNKTPKNQNTGIKSSKSVSNNNKRKLVLSDRLFSNSSSKKVKHLKKANKDEDEMVSEDNSESVLSVDTVSKSSKLNKSSAAMPKTVTAAKTMAVAANDTEDDADDDLNGDENEIEQQKDDDEKDDFSEEEKKLIEKCKLLSDEEIKTFNLSDEIEIDEVKLAERSEKVFNPAKSMKKSKFEFFFYFIFILIIVE
jgi:hypothetical protein